MAASGRCARRPVLAILLASKTGANIHVEERCVSREARCSCGELRVLCLGEPVSVSLCHCTACQRRTGAPFGLAAFFKREKIEIEGHYADYARSSDAGYGLVFHFCPSCGSTVFWEPSRKPDMIAVAVGSFGDSRFPAPAKEVHTECRHAWVQPLKPESR